jgi:hypothetical protein
MSHQISLKLHDQFSYQDGVPVYLPGDKVTVNADIHGDEPIKGRQIVITMGWRTEGKGSKNGEVIESVEVPVTELLNSNNFSRRVAFRLPDWPYSFAGDLINIVWYVELKIDVALQRDPREEQTLIMRPKHMILGPHW